MSIIYTWLYGGAILAPYRACGNVECVCRAFTCPQLISVNSENNGGFDMTFATGLAIVGVVAGIILLVTVKDMMGQP